MFDELRYVFAAIAQRRQIDRYHRNTIKKVFAKSSVGDHLFEIPIGGGDDACVDRQLFMCTYRADPAFLQHAEQLDLHRGRHLTDLI